MKKIKMLKLGTIVTDSVTDIKGMLTIHQIDTAGNKHQQFQPAGLNPKTKEPLDSYWVVADRILGGEEVDVELPLEVLGTQVEDKATGFNGTAIALYYHLNGCIHFEVKSKGTLTETGASVKSREFDYRRLKGVAIKEMTDEQLEKSKKEKPSPESNSGFQFSNR